jgi:hypothetical protein
MTDDFNMLSFALGYAKRGLKVFPCYAPIYGVCTCGDPDCGSPGKHPRTEHGVKDATTNAEQIRKWWTECPDANIGISTEEMIVIDVDAGKQGYVSLEKLETEFGKLPETWTADTGGGGQHWYFRRNGHAVKNGTALKPGIDLKTDGGYVIAAPSLHVSGKRYAWSPESAKALAEFPKEWLRLFKPNNSDESKPRFDTAGALAGVPEGERDVACWKLACKLRNADVPLTEGIELVLKAAGNCKPPFSADDAREKVERAYRTYQPKQAEPGSAGIVRNIAAEVREYIGELQGAFSTQQLYSDLGIKDAADKATARKALERSKGTLIEADGERAGWYRIISDQLTEMDLENVSTETLELKLPLHLHNKSSVMPGNVIVIAGGIDAGKTSFLLNIVKDNISKWQCHYFNSEMGPEELRKRLDLFGDFPRRHRNFHAYERSCDFQDVLRQGKYVLNVIDFLELTDEFYKVSKLMSDIHRNLGGAVAVVAIQTKTGTDLPLGGQRALEKARLAISLRAGNRDQPNVATILKCKNRLTEHSMIGKTRPYKLIHGSEFRPESPDWL